jgi:hypothetical protein
MLEKEACLMRKAEYPEWVMPHKKKGTYVNRVGDTYYLYAAHSERVKGTDKVRRVSDGYLGRITEKDGFIPAKRKLSSEVRAHEYGLSWAVVSSCGKIRSGLRREFRANADAVFAAGALLFMHGEARPDLLEASGLPLLLTDLCGTQRLTDKQRTGAERANRMIADTLKKRFGADYGDALMLLPLVRLVCMAGDRRMAETPAGVAEFCERHGLDFKED